MCQHDVMAEETLVSCDASATALRVCQRLGVVERPVAFASLVMSSAARNYSASERETLAFLWACEKWYFNSMVVAPRSSSTIKLFELC
jgi:RNase H-like domain found in reverse transcriptase